MKDSDVVIASLIRRRIKVEHLSDIIVYDATARVQCVLTRRSSTAETRLDLAWRRHPWVAHWSSARRHNTRRSRVATTPPAGQWPASASSLSLPLRERFELEASESSSRGRRDTTLGSSRLGDEVSSISSPSSMSASLSAPKRASSSSQANTVLSRAFLYSPSDIAHLGELGVVTVEVTTGVEARELPVVAEEATTDSAAADAADVPAACVVGVLIRNEHEYPLRRSLWIDVPRPAHQILTGGWYFWWSTLSSRYANSWQTQICGALHLLAICRPTQIDPSWTNESALLWMACSSTYTCLLFLLRPQHGGGQQLIVAVHDVLNDRWRDKLIGIATDGANTTAGRYGVVVTLLEAEVTHPVVCGPSDGSPDESGLYYCWLWRFRQKDQ
ncbi:unnamed protein product [Phytophthora fragariaefolia]|uniref:Unnamed protein product n=1 Tax=Phytophthora fragariaefolia TaxID=1490495 RepID=A0A9W6XAX1_9STRA|nr:unnamed protein product [Phytophthora fragariaefolia]